MKDVYGTIHLESSKFHEFNGCMSHLWCAVLLEDDVMVTAFAGVAYIVHNK